MKILWFYQYNRYYNKDEQLHAHFAKAISQHPEIELKMYEDRKSTRLNSSHLA